MGPLPGLLQVVVAYPDEELAQGDIPVPSHIEAAKVVKLESGQTDTRSTPGGTTAGVGNVKECSPVTLTVTGSETPSCTPSPS